MSVGLDSATRRGGRAGLRRWRLRPRRAGWTRSPVAHDDEPVGDPGRAPLTETFACQGAVRLAITRIAAARLWVSLLADLSPTAVDYGVAVGGNFVAVFSPWRVRPGLGSRPLLSELFLPAPAEMEAPETPAGRPKARKLGKISTQLSMW